MSLVVIHCFFFFFIGSNRAAAHVQTCSRRRLYAINGVRLHNREIEQPHLWEQCRLDAAFAAINGVVAQPAPHNAALISALNTRLFPENKAILDSRRYEIAGMTR